MLVQLAPQRDHVRLQGAHVVGKLGHDRIVANAD
jgi:hypothetical protein